MEIRSVAVLGAGAIGAYFVKGLSRKLGENLCVVAEGERKERLERDGLNINQKHVSLNVKTPDEARGADLLVIAVKYAALKPSLPMVEKIVDDHTIVLSVLNGVDSEEIVASRIGEQHVIPSVMKISIQRVGNDIKINTGNELGVLFGEKDGKRTERIDALVNLFKDSDMRYVLSDNVVRDMWYKYALNVSRNIPQAIINCGFGAYSASEHVMYISRMMREEVKAVAAAKGIDISDDDNPAGKATTGAATARFSTLQDLDAKRATEIDMFCGAMVRMGRELGVPTPFNDFAYHAVKALEEKNSGIIS